MRRAALRGALGALLLLAAPAAGAEVRGVVYVDADGDAARGPDEAPRPGVAVSDGRHVVATDADGRYALPGAGRFVSVTAPSGFTADPFYREGGGDFALRPAPDSPDFFFVQLSDAHVYADPDDVAWTVPPNLAWVPDWVGAQLFLAALALFDPERGRGDVVEGFREALRPHHEGDVEELSGAELVEAWVREFRRPGSEVARVRERVEAAFAEVAALSPEFVVSTGDMVLEANPAPPDVARGWFDLYREVVAASGLRVYETIGNNELVAIWGDDAPTDHPAYGKGLYRELFGPTHYSFDRGAFHFAATDTHRAEPREDAPPEWDFGRMEPEVSAWLDADLAMHRDRVLVVLNHEPFTSEWLLYRGADDEGLFARHGVAHVLAGHIHHNALAREGVTTHVTTGALSGQRWFVPPTVHPGGYRLFQARGRRLYSAWKELSRPVLGFVDPPGAPALHAATGSPADPDALPSPTGVVVVAADARGPFADLSLTADGEVVALERWSDTFAGARIERAMDRDGDGALRLVLRATDAAGRTHGAELTIRFR